MMTIPATAIARTASALVSFLLRFNLLPERLFFLSPGLAGSFGISTEFIGRKTPKGNADQMTPIGVSLCMCSFHCAHTVLKRH
jgi:hypothetical protein